MRPGGPVVQEMLLDFLSGVLAALLFIEWNHLCNFGRGHHGEHSCKVISNLDKWIRRRCCLKKKLTDNRHLRRITIAHLETFISGELKTLCCEFSKEFSRWDGSSRTKKMCSD